MSATATKAETVCEIGLEGEIFKPCFGYEGFIEVSNLGRVKSLSRIVKTKGGSTRTTMPRIMKQPYSPKGYRTVNIMIGGIQKHHRVHRLVMQTFVPNPEDKPEVNHINGIKDDNRLENLEWVTSKENSLHAIRTGLQKTNCGEKVGNSKLTNENVLEILELNGKVSQGEIAKRFNVCQQTVSAVVRNITWNHLKIKAA